MNKNLTIIRDNKLYQLTQPKTFSPCRECDIGYDFQCPVDAPKCNLEIYKEIKLCKNCHYHKSDFRCDYSCSHSVYNLVTGEQLNIPLQPHSNRMSELYCGPDAKWFEEKSEE